MKQLSLAYERSLLLVCMWGVLAILLTNQFSSLISIGCIFLLLLSYFLRRNGWKPSALAANFAALVVFFICGFIFFTTFNLLSATVYLFLFLQVTKHFTRQNHTESRWCYLISLFHIVGASVITTTLTFGFMLVIYIFLVLVSLRLYIIVRGMEITMPAVSRTTATPSTTAPLVSRMPRKIINSAFPLVITVVLLSGLLFSIIPRLATQNLFQAYGPPPDEPATSAFAESVEFGSFSSIQLNNSIAMYVDPLGDKRPDHIRMRGVALDEFDGKTWRRTNYVSMRNGPYEFKPAFTTRLYENQYRFRVLQPAGVTNFLFGDSFPLNLKLPQKLGYLVDPMAQTVYMTDMLPKEFQYETESLHEDLELRRDPAKHDLTDRPPSDLLYNRRFFPDAAPRPQQNFGQEFDRFIRNVMRNQEAEDREAAEAAGQTTSSADTPPADNVATGTDDLLPPPELGDTPLPSPDNPAYTSNPMMQEWVDTQRRRQRPRNAREHLHNYLEQCLQLPEQLSTGRVPDLARDWTSDQETTFARAMEVERRLRTEFTYSLTPRASGNFIENFLMDIREGHCEYFATSMAVLLRNIGIPARIVNGYYSTEWNTISSNFTVRQRDAHSWVEAWMGDDYGWMTFDPTPASGVARRNETSQFFLQLTNIMDAAKVRWYRYVVDYTFNDQVAGYRRILNWRDSFMKYIDNINIFGFSSDELTQIELGDLTTGVDWRPIFVAILVIILLLTWQITRIIARRKKNRLTDIRFYNRLLTLLARRGYRIKPGQTPREFARDVATANADWKPFMEITEHYYRQRYHAAADSPSQHLHQAVNDLVKSLRKKK